MFELIRSLSLDTAAGKAEGRAFVPEDHPFLLDHFPGLPLLPGSLLIELGAQVAGPLAEQWLKARFKKVRWAVLGMVRSARFPNPTPLPAEIRLQARLSREGETNLLFEVRAQSAGAGVLRGELLMAMLPAPVNAAKAIAARETRLKRWLEGT